MCRYFLFIFVLAWGPLSLADILVDESPSLSGADSKASSAKAAGVFELFQVPMIPKCKLMGSLTYDKVHSDSDLADIWKGTGKVLCGSIQTRCRAVVSLFYEASFSSHYEEERTANQLGELSFKIDKLSLPNGASDFLGEYVLFRSKGFENETSPQEKITMSHWPSISRDRVRSGHLLVERVHFLPGQSQNLPLIESSLREGFLSIQASNLRCSEVGNND